VIDVRTRQAALILGPILCRHNPGINPPSFCGAGLDQAAIAQVLYLFYTTMGLTIQWCIPSRTWS
jgi:hypothetical protein